MGEITEWAMVYGVKSFMFSLPRVGNQIRPEITNCDFLRASRRPTLNQNPMDIVKWDGDVFFTISAFDIMRPRAQAS